MKRIEIERESAFSYRVECKLGDGCSGESRLHGEAVQDLHLSEHHNSAGGLFTLADLKLAAREDELIRSLFAHVVIVSNR